MAKSTFKTIGALNLESIAALTDLGRQLHGHAGDAPEGRKKAALEKKIEKLGNKAVSEQAGIKFVKGETRVELQAHSREAPLCYGPTAHEVGWQTARLHVKDLGLYVLHGVTALMLRGTLIAEDGQDTDKEVDVALFEGQLIRTI